jgi:hypothetical protein
MNSKVEIISVEELKRMIVISDRNGKSSNDSEAQPGYKLIVNVPSHPFGISRVVC